MLFLEKGWTRTQIKNRFSEYEELEFKLTNDKTCYEVVGCSGFIKNKNNGKVVYINTTPLNKKLMFRTAESLEDYRGGPNQWCQKNEFKRKVLKMLGIECWS